MEVTYFKTHLTGPDRVAQLAGDLIPGQGAHLGCRFNPWLGHAWEATNWCFSLSLHLSQINTLSLGED